MLKFQYFGHLMQRTHSLEKKDPDARKDWGQEEKGETEDEMVGYITDSMDVNLSKLQELVKAGEPGVLQSVGLQRIRQDLMTEQHNAQSHLP